MDERYTHAAHLNVLPLPQPAAMEAAIGAVKLIADHCLGFTPGGLGDFHQGLHHRLEGVGFERLGAIAQGFSRTRMDLH